ncbi:MAG: hypothetical protein ACR2QH_19150 [Geminicoccaceae bacterium]
MKSLENFSDRLLVIRSIPHCQVCPVETDHAEPAGLGSQKANLWHETK